MLSELGVAAEFTSVVLCHRARKTASTTVEPQHSTAVVKTRACKSSIFEARLSILEEKVGNGFLCNCDRLRRFNRAIFILWQPSSGGKDYLFFLMGEVAALFVDAALGVQDCLLKEIYLIH